MPLKSIGFVASNGLTVVRVVVPTGPITNWLDVPPDAPAVVGTTTAPAVPAVEPALDVPVAAVPDVFFDPLVVAVFAVFAVFALTAGFVAARLAARVEETVVESSARLLDESALTCLEPLEHAPAIANTPHIATTVRIPVLPMGEAYAKAAG